MHRYFNTFAIRCQAIPPLHTFSSAEANDEPAAAIVNSDELDGKLLDMYTNIYTMRQDLDRLKKPIGTKDNPSRTCKDLFYGHPKFKGNLHNFYNYFMISNSHSS